MNVHVLLVPYDSAQRGVRLGAGPEHLIESGLVRALERGGHIVQPATIDAPADRWRAEVGTAFQLAHAISERVRSARTARAFPLVLAGNCISTLGVVAGLGPGTAVLWFDAHGDFNTPETTTGGFLDGMALAAITGRCWSVIARQVPGFQPVPERSVWLAGARDLDALEAEALAASAIRRLPVDSIGPELAELVRRDMAGADRLHVHLDLDVLDPADGRVNEYSAPNGVPAEKLIATFRALGEHRAVESLTMSAYDPSFDTDGRVARTAIDVAVALVDGIASGA